MIEISILFHNACVITALCVFQSILDFLLSPISRLEKESQGSLLFLALFNFQDAVFAFAFCATAFSLYHNFKSLSIPFLKFFQKTFCCGRCSLLGSFNIISLSDAFVKYFSKISENLFSIVQNHFRLFLTSRPTALLLYHAFLTLSTKRKIEFSTRFCALC